MKILATVLFFVFFSFIFPLQTFSQSQGNNSLLWRISGNGLGKPSYLFGTMHVYDKKAFNFKDSLYIFLQQAEGFALELNPDSANQIMEAYMNGSLKTTDHVSAKKSGIMRAIDTARITPKQKKIIEKKLNGSEEDKKNMVEEFVTRLVASDKKQENSMSTFMDAYLYEMAKQWEKKMYGLEEMSGQITAFQALQKGVKVKKAEDLIHKSEPDNESPIEKFYYKEDLDSIDIFYKDYFTDEGLDGFLYNRNKVMAAKIDSLVHLQTMFTAIGAAHLPGNKGVLALLKQKGYTVEPVFSSQRIFASDYKLKTSGKPGYVVREEQMGLEYEIPGKPNSQNGEAGKLVSYYYDLGSGLLYMTICGKLTSKESEQTPEEFASQLINQFSARSQAKIISSKAISSQGLKGLETLCMIADKGYMRLYELASKNMFYLFSLSGEIKDNLYSENAERYLASFKLVPIPTSQWAPYEFPDEGFQISIPGKPTIKSLNKKDEATLANSYTYFDANTGINYSITSSKTQPYNDFVNDESFFKNYSDYFTSNSSKGESAVSDTAINGFHGRKLVKPSIKNSWKGFVIKRGNTSYFVVAEYEPGVADKAVDHFLQSFSLINFTKPGWQIKTSPAKDFSLWAPSDIFEKHYNTTDSYLLPGKRNFYAYDRYSGLTYFMNAEPVNEYYWAPNEDSIYNEWEKNKINWNDSLINQNVIKNGQRTGRELTYADKAENTTIRKRLLLNGGIMYSFYVSIPSAFADESNIDQFFEKIKFTEEKTPDEILNNSPAKLFKDLQSGDSATFQKAYEALDKVKFGEGEFMLLLQKSLLEYPKYKNTYLSVNKKLLMLANNLYDDAEPSVKKQAVDFIKDNYSRTDKAIEEIRFELLEIISGNKSQENFELIKKLLAEKLPSKGYDYTLFRHFRDTLELAKIFYPDILQYISDTTMGMAIASLTKEMIDSNMLSANILSSKRTDILKLAHRQLKLVLKSKKNEDEFYDYRVTDLLALMGMMKLKEMDDLVNEFLKAKAVDIKKDAAIVLIKNNKPVSPLVLKQAAEDKYERAELYDDLSKINKSNLFPADFRSQQKMAESYIYQSMRNNDDDDNIDYTDAEFIYIKNIEYRYKGEKKRFYFFRINFPQSDEEDSTGDTEIKEPNSYLAIAGPFELDATKVNLEIGKNITGVYYDKKFDGSLLDDYFKDFIEQRLKWDK